MNQICHKRLSDGRLLLTRDGVNFALTPQQASAALDILSLYLRKTRSIKMHTFSIKKKSPVTNKFNTREIKMHPKDYDYWMRGGGLIQNCLPYLSADDREFLLTGLTPEDWDAIFSSKSGDDEGDDE